MPNDGTRRHKLRLGSLWIALEPVDLGNGCLHVVPGSHNGEVIEHLQYADGVHPEIPRELAEDAPAVAVPLNPGDAVFWHPRLWHMSPPNPSARTRWGGVIVTLPDEVAAAARLTDRPFLLRDGQVCDHPRRGRVLAF